GEMTADTPFCFKSGEEAVDATDPASGEDAAFYPVSTPTNEDAYVSADQFVGGGDAEGYVFDKGSKQVEAGGGEDSGANIEIPEDVANIDAADDNVVDESLDHCELIGRECAVKPTSEKRGIMDCRGHHLFKLQKQTYQVSL